MTSEEFPDRTSQDMYLLCGTELNTAKQFATSIFKRIKENGNNQGSEGDRQQLADQVALIKDKLAQQDYTSPQIDQFAVELCKTFWNGGGAADRLPPDQKSLYLDVLCNAFEILPESIVAGKDMIGHVVQQAERMRKTMDVRTPIGKIKYDDAEGIFIKAVNALSMDIGKYIANGDKITPFMIEEGARSLSLLWDSMTIIAKNDIVRDGMKILIKDNLSHHIGAQSWAGEVKKAVAQMVIQGLGIREKSGENEVDAEIWREKALQRTAKTTYPLIETLQKTLDAVLVHNSENLGFPDEVTRFKEQLKTTLAEIKARVTEATHSTQNAANIELLLLGNLNAHLHMFSHKNKICQDTVNALSEVIADAVTIPAPLSWNERMQSRRGNPDSGREK